MALLNFSIRISAWGGEEEDKKVPNRALRLFSQFLRSPRSIGTVVPSSKRLAKHMIRPIDFAKPSVIVEFGPGTGAITSEIAKRLQPHSRYIGVELNKKLFNDMQARFPELQFVNRSATDILDILKSLKIEKADAVISGIPWASLPAVIQSDILDGAVKCLRPGGVFVTYAYLPGLLLPAALLLRRQLRARFAKVETTRVVWNNFPPAFTYVCHR